ncbi:MAG: HAMP domain-containing protein [bacterium]|nr:HAMP domain-containing protein [bacterium]
MGLLERTVKPLVVLCLIGQGVLLFAGSGHTLVDGLKWPGLFFGLSLIIALLLGISRLRTGKPERTSVFWSTLLFFSIAALLATSLVAVGQKISSSNSRISAPKVFLQENREEVKKHWDDLNSDLDQILDFTSKSFVTKADSISAGELFRQLKETARRWPGVFPGGKGPFIEAIVWEKGQRSAWTGGAEPLPMISHARSADNLWRGRHHWYRRVSRTLSSDLAVELQIPLDDKLPISGVSGLKWKILPLGQAKERFTPEGNAEPDVLFQDLDNNLGLVLVNAEPETVILDQRQDTARLMLLAGFGWFVALLSVARLWADTLGFLLAAWFGRLILALSGLSRWGTWAFPQAELPASPGHWSSLLDPAYFATPFAAGMFASTADGLLTALVLAASVWAILRTVGLVGPEGESASGWNMMKLTGQGAASGFLFGLMASGVLILGRFLASMLATNANPRLIGHGVSLSFLSFWCLHLVLMLLVFSLFAFLVGIWVGRTWPVSSKWPAWIGSGVVAFVVALGISFLGIDLWWGGKILLAMTVLGLWLIIPALTARQKFLRRFIWPVILLMVSVWNYSSLSDVYQASEYVWLNTKGDLLVEPRNLSAPYLLNEALHEMREQDGQSGILPPDSHDVWRDEPAYLLWRKSSLRDLGFPLSVELTDEFDQEESLFTTGFMGEVNFQVGSRKRVHEDLLPEKSESITVEFTEERRIFHDGDELVLSGLINRQGNLGWIRVEFPIRSWRISTQLATLTRPANTSLSGYRPRSEIDKPVILLRGDDKGWLDVGQMGIPDPEFRSMLEDLKTGEQSQAEIQIGDDKFLCQWKTIPSDLANYAGEGYLLGVKQARQRENLLDLSRLMLLNLVFLALLVLFLQIFRRLKGIFPKGGVSDLGPTWSTGFQEQFLAGYLFFGLLLLLVVGTSVDRVGHERIRAEARSRTRTGLDTAVQQLRQLLEEQAYSLSGSDYINDMLIGQLEGKSPVDPRQGRQAMVFGGDGTLILDETLSDLEPEEAGLLLAAARTSPMVVMEDGDQIFVATVVPIDLSGVLAISDTQVLRDGRIRNGFFLYRQLLDRKLLGSLADLINGQATLRLGGRPVLASHPEGVFSGREPLLANPDMMGVLMDHAQAAGVFSFAGRPFAFTGAQPLATFSRLSSGVFGIRKVPAVLALAFPDREIQFEEQRRSTVLFLAGMANLILLTALMLALLMSWNLFRPLRLLLTATQSMAKGDFKAPLPESGRDEVGRLTTAFRVMRSELSSAREDLEAREKFLTSVLDRVTVGVAVVDENRRVISLNPAGRTILVDFDPGNDETQGVLALLDRFLELAEGAERWGGEMSSHDAVRTLRGAMAPLDLPDERCDTMLVFEDITEFLQTRKLAINAELARQVAHEIKNPLTPIQLSVQLLQQAWKDKHPQLDKIMGDTMTRVLTQVELLRSIAAEFSLLGRPGDLQREALDFQMVVNDTLQRYGSADSQSTFSVNQESKDLPLVLANKDSLQKILGNLMQNSLDAVGESQTVVLDIDWYVDSESVTLRWADNGSGLAPEVADRLFDPYFSTKSKGTGLGLAICRNLADRMGGRIVLRNRPDVETHGNGALAELKLPRLRIDTLEGPQS